MSFVYDGLGRLITKEWDVDNFGFGDPDTTVDYYYDGVRRIQENNATGLLSGAPSASSSTTRRRSLSFATSNRAAGSFT